MRHQTLAFALAVVAGLPAQDQPPAAADTGSWRAAGIRVGPDGFVVPAGEVSLQALLEGAAYYLQRNILWNPEELVQVPGPPLVLQREIAVDALGCEDLISELVYIRGFALVTRDADKGVYEVIHRNGPRSREIVESAEHRTPEQILRRPGLKQYVVTEVVLEHTDAHQASNALRPFLGQMNVSGGHTIQGVTVGTLGRPDSMLIGGFQDQVATLLQIVCACDRPSAQPSELVLRLERLEAKVKAITEQVAADPPGR